MIAVVQRVLSASVESGGDVVSVIEKGMLALVAAEARDTDRDAAWMANRLVGLRIFEDADGKMNLDCGQIDGRFLFVSNFTVAGNAQGGRRPSFTNAASIEDGRRLFNLLIEESRQLGADVQTGAYGKEMKVRLENDGPITIIVETPRG